MSKRREVGQFFVAEEDARLAVYGEAEGGSPIHGVPAGTGDEVVVLVMDAYVRGLNDGAVLARKDAEREVSRRLGL